MKMRQFSCLTMGILMSWFAWAHNPGSPASSTDKATSTPPVSTLPANDLRSPSDRSKPHWQSWSSIALSEDGSRIVVADHDGGLWISSDFGETWQMRVVGTPSARDDIREFYPRPVVMSADGSKIALATGKDIWVSQDFGGSWAERATKELQPTDYWNWLAISADGKVVAAINKAEWYGKDIWVSRDIGKSWRNETKGKGAGPGPNGWQSVALSSTGQKIAAVASAGAWTSPDYGQTWVKRRSVTQTNEQDDSLAKPTLWRAISSSSSGLELAVAADDGLWLSRNSGATWFRSKGSKAWQELSWEYVALSGDGSRIVAHSRIYRPGSDGFWYATNADLWTSEDSGTTWVNRTAKIISMRGHLITVAISGDGRRLATITRESCKDLGGEKWQCVGSILTSSDFGATWERRTDDPKDKLNPLPKFTPPR